jgi:hypothetical protein
LFRLLTPRSLKLHLLRLHLRVQILALHHLVLAGVAALQILLSSVTQSTGKRALLPRQFLRLHQAKCRRQQALPLWRIQPRHVEIE